MDYAVRDRPLFICGHPKSGTSLLKALLDNHPQLVVYPEETVFFRRYLPLAQEKEFAEKIALADQYLTHIFEWNQDAPPSHQANYPDRDYSVFSVAQVRDRMRRFLLWHPGAGVPCLTSKMQPLLPGPMGV